MKQKLLLSTALLGLLISGNSFAQKKILNSSMVDIQFVSDEHGPLPVVQKYGKTYLAAEANEPYSIYLFNKTNERVLAVLSVDGKNIITGQNASSNQQGYVIEANGHTKIESWGYSNLPLVFLNPEDNFGKKGKNLKEGTIGVAIFSEQNPLIKHHSTHLNQYSQVTLDEKKSKKDIVEFESNLIDTTFLRSGEPRDVVKIEYDSVENLENKAIIEKTNYINSKEPFLR